jgi:hypothetical protein
MDPQSTKSQASLNLVHTLRCTKRRVIQQVLTKLGKAEISDDQEYQILKERQLEMTENIEKLLTHMKSFVTNLVGMSCCCITPYPNL